MTQDDLINLNREVNKIPYVAGLGPNEPIDYWEFEPEAGKSWVCRDYVEDKADRLRQQGINPRNLRIVLCWTEPVLPPPNDREYHAILAVNLDTEVWLLDSRVDDGEIYQFRMPPFDYRWDRIQIAGSTDFRPIEDSDLL